MARAGVGWQTETKEMKITTGEEMRSRQSGNATRQLPNEVDVGVKEGPARKETASQAQWND